MIIIFNIFKNILIIYLFISNLNGKIIEEALTAKALAISNGFSAISCDQGCVNPASLNNIKLITITTINRQPKINSQSFLISFPIKNKNFQIETQLNDYGIFKDFISNNVFSSKAWYFGFSTKSTIMDLFSIGVKLNYSRLSIANWNNSTFTLNTGIKTKLIDGRAGIGLTIQNINLFFSKKENHSILIGTFYSPKKFPGSLSLDLYNEINWRGVFSIQIDPSENIIIFISNTTDVKYLYTGSIYQNLIAGIGIGFMLNWNNYSITYGARNLGQGGWINGISLSKLITN